MYTLFDPMLVSVTNCAAVVDDVPTSLPATGHAVDVCVYVPDLDSVLDAAPRHGGRLVVPATDTPWGERVAYLRDPEGTMLLVIQESLGA